MFNSPDTVIQKIAEDQLNLIAEMQRVLGYLRMYAEQERPVITQAPISPQEHYNMLDEELCGCNTCVDWDLRRKEFIRATGLIPKGHKWTVCNCAICRFVGQFQLNLLAAANRRELLIEMSFHARYHSRHGDMIMTWLAEEMRKPSYTDNWCAQEMSRYPMERWLKRCEMAISGDVGGPVFINSTMVTEMYTPFASSLFADVDTSRWLQ
jgi:hypothetical protein